MMLVGQSVARRPLLNSSGTKSHLQHQSLSRQGRRCHYHELRATRVYAAASEADTRGGTHGKNMFIFGLGYTALGIGNQLQKLGWTVSGTCRSEEKREVLMARGFEAHIFNPDDEGGLGEGGLAALLRADHLLTTVPPVADFNRDPVIEQHKKELIEMASSLTWVGYLSSTGVYGDYQGGWVDERSEVRAANGSGGARADAERAWLQLCQQHSLPLHIFRLGGIYGPSRSALDAARKKTAPSSSQERRAKQRFTARCHVYDIWQAVHASIERPSPGSIYNVADDDPAPRVQVVEYACALLLGGAITDQIDVADASESDQGSIDINEEQRKSRVSPVSNDSVNISVAGDVKPKLPEKRVSNAKLKKDLGVVLRFPTYREGLQAIHRGDQSPLE